MTQAKPKTQPDRGPVRPKDAAAWKKRATHTDVTLPSGAIVDIKLPNMENMLASGIVPNELFDAAIQHQNVEEITLDVIRETWEFTKFIVPRTVINPSITEEDVADLPVEDLTMIVAFAARTKDMDAVGHQLGGLDTQRSFRDARGLTTFDEVLADATGSR